MEEEEVKVEEEGKEVEEEPVPEGSAREDSSLAPEAVEKIGHLGEEEEE